MTRILLATNGSGYQIGKCLEFGFFKEAIDAIVSDRPCRALDIAESHRVDRFDLGEKDSISLNSKILDLAVKRKVDHIISPGFTRVFRGEILEAYRNRVFNCHPSILPAFKGFYDTRDARRNHHPRKIFERVLDFGSRVTGNTIHVVTENIDEGAPILVSTMNIVYHEDPKLTRHRLFVQECKCLLQFVMWLLQGRLEYDTDGFPMIKNAKFDEPYYSPNLEDPTIIGFNPKYPYDSQNT